MILLDTHVVLWWQAGGTRLSQRARREIERADRVLVSPVSFWEVSVLVEKRRVELDRNAFVWADDLLAADRVELAPLTHTAAVAAGQLPAAGFRGDPADSLLYATARELAVPLVTKDRAIRGHARDAGDVKTMW